MNKFPSTMRFIPALAAVTIGLFASGAVAQNYLQGEPGEAPGVSQDGPGKPLPVDPAEVRRDNTADPGEAPLASTTGGRPLPVDPAEVRRDNTADPGEAPLASTTGGRPLPVDPAELRRDNTANPWSLPSARR